MISNGKRRRAASDDSDEEQKTQRTVDVDEEDEEEVPPRRPKQRTAPPGRNRKGFLENSQLTEKDRRQVRYKERELLQSIKENANDLAKLMSDTFDTHTQELDQMYDNVCYPREANLDASNLDELNVAVAKQSQALGSSDLTKYDTTDFIRATQNACTMESQNGEFDWNTLGNAAGACFRSVPESSFLFGLMNTEVVRKERKKARRAQEDKDRKDAQARRLEILQTKLMEGERVKPLFDMVVNPKSFTQSVYDYDHEAKLTQNLQSHSARRGGAAFASSNASVNLSDLAHRGLWSMDGFATLLEYISPTAASDQNVAKVLGGWTDTKQGGHPPTLACFDDESHHTFTRVSDYAKAIRLLHFAKISPKGFADCLTATLLMYYRDTLKVSPQHIVHQEMQRVHATLSPSASARKSSLTGAARSASGLSWITSWRFRYI
ncbi:Cell 12A endoglucanase [Phytophthora nicotianae]|uniref:Non-structural maintenance of chromosomes element 4 n=1 Tax=Phytophthora nicotianae TaxID=4792 RepID=A0A0W8CR70_PHYNI|nr:Cell 12A endoglucanase [Phytophthora nicotianae]